MNRESIPSLRSILSEYQFFDVGLDRLWSNAAENCWLAHKLRVGLQKQDGREGHRVLVAHFREHPGFMQDKRLFISFCSIPLPLQSSLSELASELRWKINRIGLMYVVAEEGMIPFIYGHVTSMT